MQETSLNGVWYARLGIVCPLHRYKFSLSKANTSGEGGYFLKSLPIQQQPDNLFAWSIRE
jgi:3-phenylpropionate/trans-cinnamate dioxygenase ferredoxin subunit